MTTYYEILQIRRDASTDEIKVAYRRLVKETHPDTGGSSELFIQVQTAYEILSDSSKRFLYDQQLGQQRPRRARPWGNSYRNPGPQPPTWDDLFKRAQEKTRQAAEEREEAKRQQQTFNVSLRGGPLNTDWGFTAQSVVDNLDAAAVHYRGEDAGEVLKILANTYRDLGNQMIRDHNAKQRRRY